MMLSVEQISLHSLSIRWSESRGRRIAHLILVRPHLRTLFLLVTFFALAVANASAKVAQIPFAELVEGSDIIVVATVTSVSQTQTDEAAYATAQVVEVWKGQPGHEVEFLASPTWACDISGAKKGETVLLFLIKSDKSRSYAIAHSGHGRLPLRTVAGKTYAIIGPLVILPQNTPTLKGPEPKREDFRSVEITTLQDLVTRASEKKADGTKG